MTTTIEIPDESAGLTDTKTIDIEINNVNDAPLITTSDNYTIVAQQRIRRLLRDLLKP